MTCSSIASQLLIVNINTKCDLGGHGAGEPRQDSLRRRRQPDAVSISAATFKPLSTPERMLSDMEHTTHRPASSPMRPTRTASEHTPTLLLSLMSYKLWADVDLIHAVQALPVLDTAPEGPYFAAIIRHYHTVDCIFRAHLLGIPHEYTSPNPAEPATLAELQSRVRAIDDWYVEYTRQIDEHALAQPLDVKFTDGQQQVLTRSDILLHVSLHGAGHRAQVGLLLRKCGAEPPPDRFTNYLRQAPGD
jgi:uncharacterized damage-inducible protein DinB